MITELVSDYFPEDLSGLNVLRTAALVRELSRIILPQVAQGQHAYRTFCDNRT